MTNPGDSSHRAPDAATTAGDPWEALCSGAVVFLPELGRGLRLPALSSTRIAGRANPSR